VDTAYLGCSRPKVDNSLATVPSILSNVSLHSTSNLKQLLSSKLLRFVSKGLDLSLHYLTITNCSVEDLL
jgi:hypothetical protein